MVSSCGEMRGGSGKRRGGVWQSQAIARNITHLTKCRLCRHCSTGDRSPPGTCSLTVCSTASPAGQRALRRPVADGAPARYRAVRSGRPGEATNRRRRQRNPRRRPRQERRCHGLLGQSRLCLPTSARRFAPVSHQAGTAASPTCLAPVIRNDPTAAAAAAATVRPLSASRRDQGTASVRILRGRLAWS